MFLSFPSYLSTHGKTHGKTLFILLQTLLFSSSITLRLLEQDIEMKTHHAEDFYLLVIKFIEGLKARSTTALALQDFTSIGKPHYCNA